MILALISYQDDHILLLGLQDRALATSLLEAENGDLMQAVNKWFNQ